MSVRFVSTPEQKPESPVLIPPEKPKPISPWTIWLIAGVIILIIILVFLLLSTTQEQETIRINASEDIPNLDTLVNLEPNGVCCKLPASTIVTDRYAYLPDTDRTYSLDPTSVSAVCTGLTGQALTDCQNEVLDSEGNVKLTAHKGIQTYFTFSIGQAGGTICDSFEVCPTI